MKCRTRNLESPGSNILCNHFEYWSLSLYPRRPISVSSMHQYLAFDTGGKDSYLSSRVNAACVARILPRPVHLVSEVNSPAIG